jgi:cation:H+ antiporter
MLLNLILLVLGFAILIKGADVLVDGSASLAKKFGLSSLMIGLTVIAFGTSAPELIVNIFSSIAGSSDIGMGNIIGSNISNILLILGVAAIITSLEVDDSIIKKQIPFSILSALALFFLINSSLINNVGQNGLYRSGGLILILFFGIFLYYTFSLAKGGKIESPEKIKKMTNSKSIFLIILGIVGLFIGGKLIVDNASAIASAAGLSEAFIGLTIVALGTSLPELAASIVAARKNQIQMAVGNVIGSNIFNLLWVLGISALIKPIAFNPALNLDIIFLIFVSLMLFIFIYTGKKLHFTKKEGYILVSLYIIYIIGISFRG